VFQAPQHHLAAQAASNDTQAAQKLDRRAAAFLTEIESADCFLLHLSEGTARSEADFSVFCLLLLIANLL
jgi:hypothetical protein